MTPINVLWKKALAETSNVTDALGRFKEMLHAENVDWREGRAELRRGEWWLVGWTFFVDKLRLCPAVFYSEKPIPFDDLTVEMKKEKS